MTTYKKGDKVRVINPTNSLPKDQEYTILHVYGNEKYLILNEVGGGWLCSRFKLVAPDPLEEAKATLEAAGYTVTPPKPKERGKLFILKHHFGQVWPSTCNSSVTGVKTIAIVEWEEGQGLENQLKSQDYLNAKGRG